MRAAGPRLRCTRVPRDRKSTRLNSSHSQISYAVFCLKKKKKRYDTTIDSINDTLNNKSLLSKIIRPIFNNINYHMYHVITVIVMYVLCTQTIYSTTV